MRIDGEIDLINPGVSSCWATRLRVNRAAAGPLPGFAGSPRPVEQLGLSAEVAWQREAGGLAWASRPPPPPPLFLLLLLERAVTLSAGLPPCSAPLSRAPSRARVGVRAQSPPQLP